MARDDVIRAKPWADRSGSSSSYGGNALAAAAACATLRVIDEADLVENGRSVGQYFLNKLLPFVERYSFVGAVRGAGLFIGIELVADRETKEPLGGALTELLFAENLRRGLLTMSYAASFRIQPALTIDRDTVDEAVGIMTEAFDAVARHVKR
jgi:4-aminobutyrate aminotransferase / (S)-3-amino-2-methylpropionate transaminase / 5-aminovalerate transaminase